MTKPAFKPKQILWVDMEMTGLNPVNDYPLEIAAIVTDWNFKEIATYEGAVQQAYPGAVRQKQELLERRWCGVA
jgi:oligoribonuclease (3'-5' exoribonuclease)